MRKDLAHVLLGPGSSGNDTGTKYGKRRNRHAAKLDPEDADCIRGMRALHAKVKGSHSKSRGQRCKPTRILHNVLLKQVGRPWNDVYSELAKCLRSKAAVANELRDHVRLVVELNVIRRGTQLFHRERGWHTSAWPLKPGDLYVDPDDGILKKVTAPRPSTKPRSLPSTHVADPYLPSKHYIRHNGIWYEVTVRQPSPLERQQKAFELRVLASVWRPVDSVVESWPKLVASYRGEYKPPWKWRYSHPSWYATVRRFGVPVWPCSCRQINSREIRQVLQYMEDRDERARSRARDSCDAADAA